MFFDIIKFAFYYVEYMVNFTLIVFIVAIINTSYFINCIIR